MWEVLLTSEARLQARAGIRMEESPMEEDTIVIDTPGLLCLPTRCNRLQGHHRPMPTTTRLLLQTLAMPPAGIKYFSNGISISPSPFHFTK